MSHDFNLQFADFVIRSVTGILFLFQGYDRAFKMNPGEITAAFQNNFTRKILPGKILNFSVQLSAWIEFLGGIMLIAGFQRDLVLYALSTEMIFVAIAFSLIKPMWDMQLYFPRFVLLIVLLMLPPEWDTFSIDYLLS